jgi:hypothetical protein
MPRWLRQRFSASSGKFRRHASGIELGVYAGCDPLPFSRGITHMKKFLSKKEVSVIIRGNKEHYRPVDSGWQATKSKKEVRVSRWNSEQLVSLLKFKRNS